MMSAILKIKPQIDPNDAKKMEKSLFDRFKNIGKNMKKTLKDVVTGGFLGFAVGLAQNMLSPIEEVENRIKAMLDRATDLREMADEFNTSAGKLERLQNVALLNGLKPEALKAMMAAFRSTVDDAEQKISKNEPLDEKTSLVKGWVGSKDMAEAFFTFIQSLKKVTGQNRDNAERLLFGNVQYGAAKRFIEGSGEFFPSTKDDNTAKVTSDVKYLDALNFQYTVDKINQNQKEMTRYAETLNGNYIKTMVNYENRQKDKEARQLQSYADLAKARETIDKISGVMDKVTELLTKLVTYLGDFINWIQKSPAGKGFLRTIGVR